MVVFQVSNAVFNVCHCIVVIVNREDWVVTIRMDAVGGSSLQSNSRGDIPFRTKFHTKALLVDVGHDEIDKLAGV